MPRSQRGTGLRTGLAPPRRPSRSLVIVVAGLVVGAGLAELSRITRSDAGEPARGSTAAVVGVTDVCPDIRAPAPGVASSISLGALGPQVAGGTAAAAAPTPAGSQQGLATAAGVASAAGRPVLDTLLAVQDSVQADVPAGSIVIRGRGDVAAGLVVEQVTRTALPGEHGYAGTRCTPPAADSWYVGAATSLGVSSELFLANADDSEAVVDIALFTDTGQLDVPPGRGIRVGPRSRQVLGLETLAPDQKWLTVHVQVRAGRVASGLQQRRGARAGAYDGVEWVPGAGRPAPTVVLPGIPPGPGRRILLVANPSPDDASLSVELTGSDGQFVPAGLDALVLPAGTLKEIDLRRANLALPAAVRVRSDGPGVVAAAFVDESTGEQSREFAWAGAGEALTGPALVTSVVLDPNVETELLLSAPDQAAVVSVAPLPVVGQPAPGPGRRVEVPEGRTIRLPLSTLANGLRRLPVVVTPQPGSGAVYAARYLRDGTPGPRGALVTLLALRSPDVMVTLPPVRQDPAASLATPGVVRSPRGGGEAP